VAILIVAVDDKRVRDQGDLENAMARLKPGDTMYLNVIRPTGTDEKAPHQTLKTAVKVGAGRRTNPPTPRPGE